MARVCGWWWWCRPVQSHRIHSFVQGGFENLELGPEAGFSAVYCEEDLGTTCKLLGRGKHSYTKAHDICIQMYMKTAPWYHPYFVFFSFDI